LKRKLFLKQCPICIGVVLVDEQQPKRGTCINFCKASFKNFSDDYKLFDFDTEKNNQSAEVEYAP